MQRRKLDGNAGVVANIGIGAGVKVYLKTANRNQRFLIDGFGGSDRVSDGDAVYDGDPDNPSDTDRLNKDMFRNKRAQYYWYLRDRFYKTWLAVEKKRYIDPLELISISSDIKELKQLKSELIKIPRKRTSGSSLVQIMSKDEMKKKGISSPNLADMIMMIFANSDKPSVYVREYRPPVRRR